MSHPRQDFTNLDGHAITSMMANSTENVEMANRLYLLLRTRLIRHCASKKKPMGIGSSVGDDALAYQVFYEMLRKDPASWECRDHIVAHACRAIGDRVVDHYRENKAIKRGGGVSTIPLPNTLADQRTRPRTVDEMFCAELLERLNRENPEQCLVIKLRYFEKMKNREIANELGKPQHWVEYRLRKALRWLSSEDQDD